MLRAVPWRLGDAARRAECVGVGEERDGQRVVARSDDGTVGAINVLEQAGARNDAASAPMADA